MGNALRVLKSSCLRIEEYTNSGCAVAKAPPHCTRDLAAKRGGDKRADGLRRSWALLAGANDIGAGAKEATKTA